MTHSSSIKEDEKSVNRVSRV